MRLLHVVSSPADGSLCDQNCEGVAINLGTTGQLSEIAESAILDALAQRLDADAVYGDIEVGGTIRYRSAFSPTRLLSEPNACLPLAVRCKTLNQLGCRIVDPDLPLHFAERESVVLHVPAVLSRHSQEPPGCDTSALNAHLSQDRDRSHRGYKRPAGSLSSNTRPKSTSSRFDHHPHRRQSSRRGAWR